MNPFKDLFKLYFLNDGVIDLEDTDVTLCGSYILSPKGIILACNENSADAAGKDNPKDVVGACSYELLTKKDGLRIQKNDRQVITTGKTLIVDEHYVNFEGKKKIATSIKTPVRLKGKKITVIMGISITQDDNITHYTYHKKSCENQFNLTERQIDCLYYLVRGYSLKQISTELRISARTVEHYLEIVKVKLNSTRRSDLIAKAFEIPAITKRLFNIAS